MANPASVIVLGAGELGLEVLRSLATHPVRRGTTLAVLKRSSTLELADEFNRLRIQERHGDVVAMSDEQLADVLRHFDVVISCNGMTLPPDTQTKLARAAMKAGVKRYFPWQFGLSYDELGRGSSQNLFDAQLDVRDFLRAQGSMDWVIVSTGIFISFLFEPAFDVVDADRATVTALGSWDNRITATSPADIGRVVAELLFACPETKGIVYVAGDTISMKDLADVIDDVLATKVQRQLATVAELEADLQTDPENGMKKYRAVFAGGVGITWDKTATFNALRGMPMQTVKQWAQEHLQ